MDLLTKELINSLKEITKIIRRTKPEVPYEGKIKKLTLAQFEVLGYLCEHNMVKMSDIAKEFGVKLPTMTDIVDKLVEKGLVKRIREEGDRRVVWITMIPEIKKTATKVMKQHEIYLEKLLSPLSQNEKKQAIKIITKIINNIKEKEGVK